jgi:hypothetical protein
MIKQIKKNHVFLEQKDAEGHTGIVCPVRMKIEKLVFVEIVG